MVLSDQSRPKGIQEKELIANADKVSLENWQG